MLTQEKVSSKHSVDLIHFVSVKRDTCNTDLKYNYNCDFSHKQGKTIGKNLRILN